LKLDQFPDRGAIINNAHRVDPSRSLASSRNLDAIAPPFRPIDLQCRATTLADDLDRFGASRDRLSLSRRATFRESTSIPRDIARISRPSGIADEIREPVIALTYITRLTVLAIRIC